MPGPVREDLVFLGVYHFDGEPSELARAYKRMMKGFPPDSQQLHVCLVRGGGLSVYDACPSAEVFREFSRSAGFLDAVSASGLPMPRVEPLGDVLAAQLREPITP
jgi:hypothetical protein